MLKKYIKIIIVFYWMLLSGFTLAETQAKYNVTDGDSLIAILKNNDIKREDIKELIYKTKGFNKISNLKIGQRILIIKSKSNYLLKMLIQKNGVNLYKIIRVSNKGFKILKIEIKVKKINKYVFGTVYKSTDRTLIKMGLNKFQRLEFIKMFGNKFDINKLEKGTTLSAVYPVFYKGKITISCGRLTSVKIQNRNGSKQIFAFPNAFGIITYYDKRGRPSEQIIDRSPLMSYKRVSSMFSPHRKHPIFGTLKPHNGVDYAAKYGTEIYAAADGRIALKDHQDGYGNVIVINHYSGYSTLYAHMSKFKKGIYSGEVVKKGDVIGYVGSTGISTGNHLHYEIRKSGKYLDPIKANLPMQTKISKKDTDKFIEFASKYRKGFMYTDYLNKRESLFNIALANKNNFN